MNRPFNRFAALAVCLCTTTAFAQEQREVLRLQPDFTFKRVGAPTGADVGRITVQIDTDAQRLGPVYADHETAPTPAVVAPIAPSGLEWFWSGVTPNLIASAPARFQKAMELIISPPDGCHFC